MQNSGKTSSLRTYGEGQEWGKKRRKRESKMFRARAKARAIKEARNDG